MSADILDWLRENSSGHPSHGKVVELGRLAEAAAEIGRLRGEVKKLAAAVPAVNDPSAHKWDADGERCVKCGDKDWMGGPCTATHAPAMPNGVEDIDWPFTYIVPDSKHEYVPKHHAERKIRDALRAADNRDAAGVDGEAVARHVEVLRAIGSAFDGIPAPCEERDAIASAIAALTTPPAAQVQPPHCPDCGAGALYECPACSSTNYPRDAIAPQPADGEAVAEWQVWHEQDGWGATHPDNVAEYRARGVPVRPLYAHPPAPVQAAPQEGCPFCGGTGGHWEGCRAPVDTTAHPSSCELGELEALREFYAAWKADNATGPSQRRLAAARDRVAALQHRGDSRGGEAV